MRLPVHSLHSLLSPFVTAQCVHRAVAWVACGHRHTVAVLRSGGVLCWGWNLHGQCGGDSSSFHEPAALPGLAGLRCIQVCLRLTVSPRLVARR